MMERLQNSPTQTLEEDRMRNVSQALVSVIVHIYNVEKYLDQCLDSI